jgi:hypothetical protein
MTAKLTAEPTINNDQRQNRATINPPEKLFDNISEQAPSSPPFEMISIASPRKFVNLNKQ